MPIKSAVPLAVHRKMICDLSLTVNNEIINVVRLSGVIEWAIWNRSLSSRAYAQSIVLRVRYHCGSDTEFSYT